MRFFGDTVMLWYCFWFGLTISRVATLQHNLILGHRNVVLLVQLLGQEIDLGQRNDQRTDDAQQQTKTEVQVANQKFDTDEAERKAGGHREEKLRHCNHVTIDRFHCKTNIDGVNFILDAVQRHNAISI